MLVTFVGLNPYSNLTQNFFCLVLDMPLCTSVYMCLVVTCWDMADLLALVCRVLL